MNIARALLAVLCLAACGDDPTLSSTGGGGFFASGDTRTGGNPDEGGQGGAGGQVVDPAAGTGPEGPNTNICGDAGICSAGECCNGVCCAVSQMCCSGRCVMPSVNQPFCTVSFPEGF